MPESLDSIISSLKGYFGGNRRSPEEKVGEMGGLFNRLMSPGDTPSDPRNAPPPPPPMPQPTPEPAPEPVPEQPQAPPEPLAQTLLPQEPQIDLNQLIQQAMAQQQFQESLIASLLSQPQGFGPQIPLA